MYFIDKKNASLKNNKLELLVIHKFKISATTDAIINLLFFCWTEMICKKNLFPFITHRLCAKKNKYFHFL